LYAEEISALAMLLTPTSLGCGH